MYGGSRNDPDLVEPVLFTQPHGAGTVIVRLQDLASYRHRAAAQLECRAGCHAPSRSGQRVPDAGRATLEQQELDLRAGVHTDTVHPRRKHPAVVEHQHVAGAKVIEQVGKDAMLETPLPTMYDHQTRTVPRLDRRLGDQLLREVVGVGFKAQVVGGWH